jgi:Thymidylate kinase
MLQSCRQSAKRLCSLSSRATTFTLQRNRSMVASARRGCFFVFEGLDRAGKSTQAQMLHRYLEQVCTACFCTRVSSLVLCCAGVSAASLSWQAMGCSLCTLQSIALLPACQCTSSSYAGCWLCSRHRGESKGVLTCMSCVADWRGSVDQVSRQGVQDRQDYQCLSCRRCRR